MDPTRGPTDQVLARLTEGLTLSELMSEDGTTFEVNFDDLNNQAEDELAYDPKEVQDYTNANCAGFMDEDDYKDGAPFEVIGSKMKNVLEDGKIKKRILREGYGEVQPNMSHVSIHYNAYLEYSDEPFDSTYIRKRPFTFRLNEGSTLPGLDMAVQTMKLSEKAQFLVHPDFAYGPMGCLERVPANSTVLFEIELVNTVDSGASVLYPQLDEHQQKDFREIYNYAHALCAKANDLYSKGLFKLAIKEYNTAVTKLELCKLADYHDQEMQQQLLLRLYTNLVVVLTKLKEPRRACLNCNKIYNMCKGTVLKVPTKVLFNHGRSLMLLNDYDKAEKYLKQARAAEPQNVDISRELVKLDAKKKENYTREVTLAKAIFRNNEINKEPHEKFEVTKEFRDSIVQFCTELNEDVESSLYNLPDKLMDKELEFIKKEVVNHGLELKSDKKHGAEKYYIAKPSGANQNKK